MVSRYKDPAKFYTNILPFQIMEAERIEEESIRVNQANIAMQIDEAQKLKAKHQGQAKLKEILDQGNHCAYPVNNFILQITKWVTASYNVGPGYKS